MPGFRAFTPRSLTGDVPWLREEHLTLTLAAAASLLTVACWIALLGNTIALDAGYPRGAGIARAIAWTAAIAGAVASLAMLALAAHRGIRVMADQHIGTGVIVILAAGFGTATCVALAAFALSGPLSASTLTLSGLFAADRALDVRSFMSPSLLVVTFAGIGYVWAYWSLRCLRHQAFTCRQGAPIVGVLAGGDERLAQPLVDALSTTIHPTGGYFIVPAAAAMAACSADGR